MAQMARKWTMNRLHTLYTDALDQFGPFNSWENKTSPGYGRDKEFETFINRYAMAFNVTFGSILYKFRALSSGEAWKGTGVVSEKMRDLVVAYEAGFIMVKDFPTYVLLSFDCSDDKDEKVSIFNDKQPEALSGLRAGCNQQAFGLPGSNITAKDSPKSGIVDNLACLAARASVKGSD
jgi:hypothetical protein